jgi:hypothetical protein
LPGCRHRIQERLKGPDDAVQVRVDVGVVVFDGGKYPRPWLKMHELRPLIEKGRVVFIAFQDYVGPTSDTVIGLEIFGDTTHHEPGV